MDSPGVLTICSREGDHVYREVRRRGHHRGGILPEPDGGGAGSPTVTARPGLYRRGGKRALDLLVCVPAVVLLSPLLGLVALLVRLDLGSPILYRQVRPGKDGRPFTIRKFRSMTMARDRDGRPLPENSPEAYEAARRGHRVTRLSRLLRRLSLDELPQLFNVIEGSMSLVGPRPLLPEYLDRYTPEQARRHEVHPGITGWAQVHGRQALSYESRFELDVWYVDHVSLGLDLRILATTIVEVIRGRGVSQPGYTTGTEFMGTRSDGPDDGEHGNP